MDTKNKFFKIFGIPTVLFVGMISLVIYISWRESKFKNTLIKQALEGNRHAISILAKYEKTNKLDEKVVYEALKGNKYALEILKIEQ